MRLASRASCCQFASCQSVVCGGYGLEACSSQVFTSIGLVYTYIRNYVLLNSAEVLARPCHYADTYLRIDWNPTMKEEAKR